MRVRISTDALRLSALVAAGVASGYLWRAAFEPAQPEVRALAPSVNLVGKPNERQTTVRIPAPHATAHRRSPARRHVVHPHVVRSTARSAAPVTTRPAPGRSGPPRKPSPKPPPEPTPAPPVSTPTVTAAPAQPPPPATSVPVASGTPTPPPAETESDRERPGWGHGDKHHDHGGPPGHGG